MSDWPFLPAWMSLSVVLPTYNESANINTAMDTIEKQSVVQANPSRVELIVVDSYSTDGTFSIAQTRGWKVILAPKGKLNARDLATRQAQGNIIFAVDADVVYPPRHFETFLSNFDDPTVIGVSGPFAFNLAGVPWWFVPLGYVGSTMSYVDSRYFLGQNSAYFRRAYDYVGGYDLTVNQFSHETMREEEEFRFGQRLSRLGRVVWDTRSIPLTNPRRVTGTDMMFNVDRSMGNRF